MIGAKGLEQKITKVTKCGGREPSGDSGTETGSITVQCVLMEKALEPPRPLRSPSEFGWDAGAGGRVERVIGAGGCRTEVNE
jgi:hypothetical protein